jgi:hypothetical protein
MKPERTNVKKITTPYFPKGFKFAAPLVLVGGLYLTYIKHEIWGSFFILAGIIILTTHYATQINLVGKRYHDYLFFLGLRLNSESGTFRSIEKIVITKGDYEETITTMIQSRDIEFSDYTGTIVFSGNHKLDLLTDMDKKRLLKRIKEFAVFLKVGVEDRTSTHPYWIDIDKY